MDSPLKRRWLKRLTHDNVTEATAIKLCIQLHAGGLTPTKGLSTLQDMEINNPKFFDRLSIRLGIECEGALTFVLGSLTAAAPGDVSQADGQPPPKRHCATGAPSSASVDGMRYLPGHVPTKPSPGSSSAAAAAAGGSSGTTIPRKAAMTEQVQIKSSSESEADDESDEDSKPVANRSRRHLQPFGPDPGNRHGTPAQRVVSKKHWKAVRSRYVHKLFRPVTKAIEASCAEMVEICRKKTEVFGQVAYNSLLLIPSGYRENAVKDMLGGWEVALGTVRYRVHLGA